MQYKKYNKLILLITSLLILFAIMPCITAAENDTSVDSEDTSLISDTSHDTVSGIETSIKTQNNLENNIKTYPDFEDNDDYYFDINSNDSYSDGTKSNPYKTLNGRIFNYTNIHLSEGEYNYTPLNSYRNIAIYGEDSEKTIINGNGGVLIVGGEFVLRNITLFNLTIINQGNLKAYNTIFSFSTTTTNNGYGGSIFSTSAKNELYFNSCIFKNSHADYGGAIYTNDGKLEIVNSKFINNTASIFGGAILSLNSTIQISYTDLINNSANYAGGAIYQIYNTLKIDSSNLFNNTAKNGGAVYSSLNENTVITNNRFQNNYADNYGGALFIDEYCLKITNNEFKDNHANIDAGAIYSISNSSIQTTIINNTYINNIGTLHDDLYENPSIIFISNGNYTLYHINITYNGVIPSKYDLRDYGYVSRVKNQDHGGNCWAFYSLSALESAILKASDIKLIELSEENMKNLISLYSSYGWSFETNKGGYDDMSIGYLTSWLGPIYETNDIYDDASKLSPVIDSIMHVQNIIFLKRNSYTDNNAIKEAILKYGAVATGTYYDSIYKNYNNAYYYIGEKPPNHGVLIVGWDDNYSKYNFKTTAPGDGAWIAKNSWGTNWGDDGYYYISYYDTKFAEIGKEDASFVFLLNDTIKYDKNYQYDIPGKTDYFLNTSSTIWYKNIFKSTDEEYLVAVSTYFEKETDWELIIKVGDILKLRQVGHSSAGYYTINLNELIPLNTGDLFEVIFKITVDKNAGIPISEIVTINKYFYKENISFLSYDGNNWIDLYQLVWTFPDHIYNSQVACIKAFTILNPINTSIKLDIINRDDNIVNLIATVYNQYGFLVDSGELNFKIGDEEIIKPVLNGIANLTYRFTENINTTITARFEKTGYVTSTVGKLISNNLINTKINLTLFSNHNHNPLNISAYVTDLEDNPVASGFVIFEVVGKNYTINLIDGFANLTNVTGGIGENNITAYYTDNSFYYNQSYNTIRTNIEIIDTKMKLEIDSGNPYVIIAHVADLEDNPVVSGLVEFNIGGEYVNVPVFNGISNITYLFKNIGEQAVIANYIDYNNIYKSSHFSKTINVTKIKLHHDDVDLTIKHDNLDENRVVLSLKIPKCLAEYYVNLEINGNSYYRKSEDNCVVLDLKDLDDGNYICKLSLVSPIYELVDDFSKEFNVTTIKTKLIAYDASFYKNGEYSVILKDRYDNAVINREVFLSINGRTYKNRTNYQGIAVFLVNQNISTYPVQINFVGDYKYAKSQINVELIFKTTIILPTRTEYSTNLKYEFTILDNQRNPKANQDISITVNGVIYHLKTDINGKTTLTTTLSVGYYEIIIINPLTGEKVSQKIRVSENSNTPSLKSNKILKNKDITTYYNSGVKYTVRVYKDGKVVGAGEIVRFKINKKYYYVKTNKKGYASLKITQKPGKYKIYATYNKYTVSNKIIVKSTIITKNITKNKGKKIKFSAKLVNTKGKILKNKKITFKIKGKTYKAKTNKKGIAKIYIRLKLKVGKYKITTKYGKLEVSNIIKIKK